MKYFVPYNLTNCKCTAYIGSVAEMKGNKARVVFFLHPADQGKVVKVSPLKSSFGVLSLSRLLMLLGLGVLVLVFLTLGVPYSHQVPVSTAGEGSDTKTKLPMIERSTFKLPARSLQIMSPQSRGDLLRAVP